MLVVCEACGKEFKTFPSRVRDGKAHYCSKKCYLAHYRFSEATRMLIGQKSKERPKSSETVEKLRQSMLRHYSDPAERERTGQLSKIALADPEVRERISLAGKGLKRSPETRARMSAAQRERFADPAERLKSSERRKAQLADPREREKISSGLKTYLADPDNRARRSEQQKAVWSRPNLRALTSKLSTERWSDPTMRERVIESLRSTCNQPSVRQQRRDLRKTFFADPECRERHAAGIARYLATHGRTNIEQLVADILSALHVLFEEQRRISHYVVDFFLPDLNLVIECDGRYWHSRASVIEKDARRDAWLTAHGYKVLRLAEHDINADARLAVVEGLRNLA